MAVPLTRLGLRERPLRVAGQSLEGEIEDLLGELSFYTLLVVALIGLVAVEWVRVIWPAPPNPMFMAALTLPIIAYGLFRLQRTVKRLRRVRRGQAGERAVAEILESLRVRGAVVFHDIPAPGFNVDHLVLCPQGVYAIETKTYSKKPGDAIDFRSGFLHVGGRRCEKDPIQQAKAEARWIRTMLAEGTGRDYAVRPVLLFPGWFVQPMQEQPQREVWVLNPKALPAFLEGEPDCLTPEDLSIAAYHISRHIKAI